MRSSAFVSWPGLQALRLFIASPAPWGRGVAPLYHGRYLSTLIVVRFVSFPVGLQHENVGDSFPVPWREVAPFYHGRDCTLFALEGGMLQTPSCRGDRLSDCPIVPVGTTCSQHPRVVENHVKYSSALFPSRLVFRRSVRETTFQSLGEE